MKNVPTNLSNFKSKANKLDIDKLVPVPVNLYKLSTVVKHDAKDVYNAKIKNIEEKILGITNLAMKTTLNAKTNEGKEKMPNITNLATTTQKLMKLKRKLQIMIMINTLLLQNLIR